MRNRIIAALADALVVIESKTSGGSIITAEFANEYNKDVFAIPGRPGDEWSGGCKYPDQKKQGPPDGRPVWPPLYHAGTT